MRLTNKTNLNGKQLKAFIRAVAVREQYSWAENLPLSFNEPVKRETKDEKISTAVDHCEKMIEQWQRRVKLAKTKETFWQRKLRYYNKRQAAASSANPTAAVEKISTAVEAATSTATSAPAL